MPDNEPRQPQPRPPAPTTWRTIGELGTVGLSFVMALVMGVGAGHWIDQRFHTAPWGLLIGFGCGFAAGVLNVYRITSRALRDTSRRR